MHFKWEEFSARLSYLNCNGVPENIALLSYRNGNKEDIVPQSHRNACPVIGGDEPRLLTANCMCQTLYHRHKDWKMIDDRLCLEMTIVGVTFGLLL